MLALVIQPLILLTQPSSMQSWNILSERACAMFAMPCRSVPAWCRCHDVSFLSVVYDDCDIWGFAAVSVQK